MLTFAGSEEKQNSGFHLLGTVKPHTSVNLISDNTSLISNNVSILSSNESGLDTCSFYSGPSDAAILSFGEQAESCGSVAYSGSESCGSIAYSGSESCGSIASSAGSSFSGGCSYSC